MKEFISKNKKLLIILGSVLVLAITAVLLYFFVFKEDKKDVTPSKTDCEGITGGSFNLVFNTNDGEKIENMHVCIACPPDSYENLPEAKKDGYVFAGWFYDSEFKNAVTATSSLDIEPKAKKDKNGCVTGYEDITLYAKWEKEGNKTLKVVFDSNGGSKVNSIEVKCDNSGSATLSNLPKSTRNGYEFIAWNDQHGKAILNGAKIVCNGELKLKASWDKNSSYSCADGWTLDGNKCHKSYNATLKCTDGSYNVNGNCVEIVVSKKVAANKTCNSGTKVNIGYDVCKADRISVDSQSSCETAGGVWFGNEGACYEKGEMKYSCQSGYEYISNPNTYVSGIHGEAGCYPVSQKIYACSDSNDKLEGTKCTSTVDAKLN